MKKLLNKFKALKKAYQIALAALLAAILILIGCVGFYQSNLQAVSSSDKTVMFQIREGQTSDQIITNLKEQKLIKNTTVTKLYMKMHGLSDMKAGFFDLNRSWDTEKILKTLNDSKKAKQDQVVITFKEGVWAKDIASQIQTKMGIDANTLTALWNDDTYLKKMIQKYEFLDDSILNPQTKVKLEGYLFPETYAFNKRATPQEITETFLDHFDVIYQKYKKEIKASGKSMHDLITMASIVQYEARTASDMKLVAGVFYNRLDKDMTLGSSVTVCYALYDQLTDWKSCEINYDLDSPYNTNLYKGLPIGPILNPGENAIEATLNPTASDYLYFVADVYGNGDMHFAKTYEEHQANIEKYNLGM